jgi:hypothetical protein
MMKKLICIFTIACVFSGCGTLPLDETKPIEYRNKVFDVGLYQDGHFLDQVDAVDKINKNPAAHDEILKGNYWGWSGAGLTFAGLLFTSSDAPGRVAIGVGLIVATFPVIYVARSHFSKAADIYNRDLASGAPKPTAKFFLSPVKDGGIAGVALSF